MQPVTDPSHWLQVVMPFINLTLMESNTSEWTIRRSIDSQLHGRYQLSLDEVVDSVKKGSKILMEGRPGVGKTTMLRHIAKQWAEGKLLQSFQFVILIRLGDIPSSRISSLESMLEYHSYDYPDTASVARELGRTGGEGRIYRIMVVIPVIWTSFPSSCFMQLVSNPKVNHQEPLSLQFVCNQG